MSDSIGKHDAPQFRRSLKLAGKGQMSLVRRFLGVFQAVNEEGRALAERQRAEREEFDLRRIAAVDTAFAELAASAGVEGPVAFTDGDWILDVADMDRGEASISEYSGAHVMQTLRDLWGEDEPEDVGPSRMVH